VQLLECNSSLEFVHEIFSLKYKDMMTAVALLWCWWTERNKANHNEKRLSPAEFQFTVRRHTREWTEFFKSKSTSIQQNELKWQPPQRDWIMINTDGSYKSATGNGGWGCIARDHACQPIFAAAGSVANVGEPLQTETHALLEAISLADQFGIGRPVFATDCLVLKQAVNSNDYDDAPLGALFREVKYNLWLNFIDYRVIYVHRSCNKPAHELAALGAAEPQSYHNVWVENYPIAVTSAMSGDYAVQV
jgi:hypothetical protein